MKILAIKSLLSVPGILIVMGALLFLPARTLNYRQA
jgi:hypothetical protein